MLNLDFAEQTLVLIKPDACERNLIGAILAHYEQAGLEVTQLKMLRPARKLVAEHYEEHLGQPYYEGLLERLTDQPIVALVMAGQNAVARVRNLNGATDPAKASPGTVRALYAIDTRRNSVHASDSEASAAREIALWFGMN
ncbi:MAG: nucleoside-diphosphate kinase [Clostridia bacterium]|nr:nucleoside-diphosphate kinase [Clostridia bacterium]